MDKKFSLLILGGGAVVTEFYLPALACLSEEIEVTVVDRSENTLRSVASAAPFVTVQSMDFRGYLTQGGISNLFDAVIISLPNSLHQEAVEMSLQNGLPVLCEKPLTLNAETSLSCAKAARDAGLMLAVGMTRRFMPGFKALRQAIDGGLIGKIASINVEFGGHYGWLSDTGDFFQSENGGVLADMGVHFLDLVELLVGDLEPIKYKDDWKGGVEANCEMLLKVRDTGISVRLALSRTRELENKFCVRGEDAEVYMPMDSFDHCVWYSHKAPGIMSKIYPEQPFNSGNFPSDFISCFIEQFYDFIERLRQDNSPMVSAEAAARTISLVEWAYETRKKQVTDVRKEKPGPTPMPAPTIITGATGFIGSHLVARLHDMAFEDLCCPVRNYRTCAELSRFPVEKPLYNILDYSSVKMHMKGRRWVFHLAYGAGSDQSKINIKGTINVVEAAIECGAECVVVLSTMYVYGHPDTDDLVDETWPYNPTGGEYGESKAKMERWLLKRAKSSGKTRIVVLNPSCVYGPRGVAYTCLPASLAAEKRFSWVDEGKGVANVTYIDNLVDAMLLASATELAHGERFLINDGSTTWREFLEPMLGSYAKEAVSYSQAELINMDTQESASILDVFRYWLSDYELISILDRIPLIGSMKRSILRLSFIKKRLMGMRKSEGVGGFIGKSKPVPPYWLAEIYGVTRTRFTSGKAENILGWKSDVSIKQGQKRTVDWLNTTGRLVNNK